MDAPAVRPLRLLRALSLALVIVALGPMARAQVDPPLDEPFLADVDLHDVPVERALRFLAELYDVSVATGQLPEARVTVRLRGVSVAEAFESVAAAGGLRIEQQGSVVLVLPRADAGDTRQILLSPFPPESEVDWIAAAGVEVRRISEDAVILEGTDKTVQEVAAALRDVRQGLLVDRVFHLGVTPGEEILQAIQPLLEEGLESASYDAVGHVLTVSALPARLDRIERLLTELRRPPTQFEIEVQVVEVSRNALKRMGVQGTFGVNIRGGLLPSTFPLDGVDDSARYFPSPNELAELSRIGNVSGGASRNVVPGSLEDSGFRFGQVDWRGVGLLIEFLEQSGEARVVATPKVAALDNRTARINMVTTLRIPTFTQNQAFAVTTVSGIEEVDVGTTLEVRPRQGEGREILLTVTPEVSELEPAVETFTLNGLTQGLPIVTRRRTETEVILEAGETLVIGGLVREREAERVGETPVLSKIPVIGRAFQHKSKDSVSSELLVFVTPHVLPPPEERRAKVRVDAEWVPAGLAAQVNTARGLLASSAAAERIAGVWALERIDGDLLDHNLDLTPDVLRLSGDPSLDVQVAAALFMLRWRPTTALAELVRFADSRVVALSALAAPMAPHLRAALAELVARSQGGTELLLRQLRMAIDAGDPTATSYLFEALSAAAPERAAEMAAAPAGTNGALPATLRLDALSEAAGNEDELARYAHSANPEELRAFAVAALVRALGPTGTADLLEGRSPLPADASLERSIQALEPFALEPLATEPALAWSGSPVEIRLRGDLAGTELVRQALELLANKAPDLRQLVGFALAEIEVGAGPSSVDPASRTAVLSIGQVEPLRLAHRLVRLATMVFESRVRGFPATGGRSLARGVREEIRALERLTGAPCSPERAEWTVQQVLLAARGGGVDDV